MGLVTRINSRNFRQSTELSGTRAGKFDIDSSIEIIVHAGLEMELQRRAIENFSTVEFG